MSTPTANELAAIRHAVYGDLLHRLPIASYEQARRFVANLKLVRHDETADKAARERKVNAALFRFLNLRVTPDIATKIYGNDVTQKEIEFWLNRKFGDRLQHVAGFYRLDDTGPFRLNLPFASAMYGYSNGTTVTGRCEAFPQFQPFTRHFYGGILCQPIDKPHFYFLLTSSKHGGPKALKLTPQDQMYFTQFEEGRV